MVALNHPFHRIFKLSIRTSAITVVSSTHYTTLLLVILINLSQLDLVLLLERVHGDAVQAEHSLVGVLDEDVLALVHAQDHVDDGADNTPSVVEVERHLGSELAGLVGEHAEDDVVVVVLGVGTGDKSADGVSMRTVRSQGKARGRGVAYPSFMVSAFARMDWTAQRASLHELFFISVARTAPRWLASLDLQSRAPPAPWALLSNSLSALMVRNWSSPLMLFLTTASSSVRTIRCRGSSSRSSERSKRRYL